MADVMSICWTLITTLDAKEDKFEICGLIVSAIGTFAPGLLEPWLRSLRENGGAINELRYPSTALKENYHVLGDRHTSKQNLIYCALLFILPFKNVTKLNYENFVAAQVKAMIGVVGMTENEAERVQFPLDLHKAKVFAAVFSQSLEVKRGIIEYIMRASERTGASDSEASMRVFRYACAITAWSEMNLIVLINNSFLATNSPVLKYQPVTAEVKSYCRILAHICRSDRPQYFRYFCSHDEEHMLDRNNYPKLAQAALMVSNGYSKNHSLANFAGTTEAGSEIVRKMVKLHKEFINERGF